MAEHNRTGKKGEEIAVNYLRTKGYEILFTNKQFGRAEVDIIAKIGNEYVFVEVKARTSDYFGFPEESIGQKKINMLGKAADDFSNEFNDKFDIRFDLIALILSNDGVEITHIEDAFTPGLEEF